MWITYPEVIVKPSQLSEGCGLVITGYTSHFLSIGQIPNIPSLRTGSLRFTGFWGFSPWLTGYKADAARQKGLARSPPQLMQPERTESKGTKHESKPFQVPPQVAHLHLGLASNSTFRNWTWLICSQVQHLHDHQLPNLYLWIHENVFLDLSLSIVFK